MVVVDQKPDDLTRIYFGAWVTLEDEFSGEFRYRIVGPDELDMSKGYISVDSPMGRGLLKKQVDDEFSISTPDGVQTYFVVAISYMPYDD